MKKRPVRKCYCYANKLYRFDEFRGETLCVCFHIRVDFFDVFLYILHVCESLHFVIKEFFFRIPAGKRHTIRSFK